MNTPAAQPSSGARGWRPVATRLAAVAGAALVLLGVLALYTQPGFLVMLSEMIWACFG